MIEQSLARLLRVASAFIALGAFLAGCGSSSVSPIGVPNVRPGAVDGAAASWMSRRAISEDLLYIADQARNAVDVYAFPQLQRVGRIGIERPNGECVDTSGNVWVVSATGGVFEYAHGGSKRMNKLSIYAGDYPSSCAVDPKTGNLAVVSYHNVYVFAHAAGIPKKYRRRWAAAEYAAYDPEGNLYVTGTVGDDSSNWRAAVWELRDGQRPLRRWNFQDQVDFQFSSGIQWDGQHIAWGQTKYPIIYQIDKPKKVAKVIGSTDLIIRGGYYLGQFYLLEHTAFVPYFRTPHGGAVAIFNYPSGGDRVATIKGFRLPVAVTYSPAATR